MFAGRGGGGGEAATSESEDVPCVNLSFFFWTEVWYRGPLLPKNSGTTAIFIKNLLFQGMVSSENSCTI